jgi:LPS-assembly protein
LKKQDERDKVICFCMNQLSAFLLVAFFFILPFPLLGQSTSNTDETAVEQTGGVYPTEIQGSDTNDIEPNRDNFGNPRDVPSPKYTNELHISSQTQNEIRPNYYLLEGYVDISNKGVRLQADHAEYNAATRDLIATGNVVLDQTDQRITGDRLELNLDTQTGTMYNVFGYFPPQIFFWGTKLDKLGKDEYRIYDGVFTECSQLKPHWQLDTTRANMTINEYIHFKNFTLKAKKIPIFYSPYMLWPIKRDRSTGFLFPSFGPNNRKGFWTGGSFFWAMTRSMDSTYWIDHWTLRGYGGGAEYRYASDEKSDGSAKFYYANDRLFGPQWTLGARVRQNLPADFRLASTIDVFSSFDYVQDVERSIARKALRQERAQGFLTRNWSYYSLNLLGDWSNTQQDARSEIQIFHSPEVEFQSRSQKIGSTPLFWSLDSSFSALGRGTTLHTSKFNVQDTFSYQRYDLFPSLSFPITYLSWLTLTPEIGYRITQYSKQRQIPDPHDVLPVILNEALTRNYWDLTLDFRGPNFGKIFETPGLSYSQKWKHAIEPQITYHYLQNIPELANIIQVDELDDPFRIRGLKVLTYSLSNLLYAKRPVRDETEYQPDQYQYYNPKPLEEPVDSAYEFISWRLSQSYFFNSDSFDIRLTPLNQRFSPLTSDLRISPTPNYNIDFRLDYDVYYKGLTNITVSSTFRSKDAWYANIGYTNSSSIQNSFVRLRKAAHQIRTNGGTGLWKNRLVLNGEFDYDIENSRALDRSLSVMYNDDCFSVGMEWRRYSFNNENQITFSVSLPNIGSLVNYHSATPPRRF